MPFAEVNGTRMHYTDSGGAGPAVVFSHGLLFDGSMFGAPTTGDRFEIESSNPKVYLPIGNCLMGHIDGPDAMALAWMNSVGVNQMIGYTVVTWYGFGGWGVLDAVVLGGAGETPPLLKDVPAPGLEGVQAAVALYGEVRDRIRYSPWGVHREPYAWKASAVLATGLRRSFIPL